MTLFPEERDAMQEEDVKNFFKPAKEFIQIVQSKLD